MSLLNNHLKKDDKKGGKSNKPTAAGAKAVIKPGKGANISKKPIKTGGTRGS